jgi:hypothetical protein
LGKKTATSTTLDEGGQIDRSERKGVSIARM